MNAQSGTHPSDAELQAYARGALNDEQVARVLGHLDDCAACRERSANLPSQPPRGPGDPPTEPQSTFVGSPAEATAVTPGTLSHLPPTTPVAAAPPPELAGLPGFEFVRNLGQGGMGVVFLARNKLMDRLEVLKVMNRALLGRPDAVERFLQEIRSAARLIHPNVATAFSAHSAGEVLILAMEYVDGEDLSRFVRAHGPLSVAEACRCVAQAAAGLQRAYELGLVHRDIKPGNLILTREGGRPVVKIIDFGLAKAKTEMPADKDLTGTNEMMGTPGYTAFEQLRDAKSADIRADIYSLGCTLYYLLVGSSPFPGESAYDILLSQQVGTVGSLREQRPDVGDDLAAVVAKMMAHNAADRYQRPDEVVRALAKFQDVPAATMPFAGPPPGYAAAPPTARTMPLPTPRGGSASAGGSGVRTLPLLSAGSSGSWIPVATPPRKKFSIWDFLLAGALLAGLGLMLAVAFHGRQQSVTLSLRVSEPAAEVFVDGAPVAVEWLGDGKDANVSVRPGTRTVEVRKPGFQPETWQPTVRAGDHKHHHFHLRLEK